MFATYLHPHTCYTSKPMEEIRFMGHSVPHFSALRERLAAESDYPSLPVRKTDFSLYESVHAKGYLTALQRMAKGEPVEEEPRLSGECTGYEFCLPGHRYGLGGMLEAVDRMKAGKLERAYVFSLGGHHAYADWGHGYCILNPMAAAVRYAQRQGFERVLIVDWDIHHGDGTQSIFANDSSVLCISIHSAVDLYMTFVRVVRDGTTEAAEAVGQCNIPVLDAEYGEMLVQSIALAGTTYRTQEVLPALQGKLDNLPFTPDMIFIFSGYDSHKDDCGNQITHWDNGDYQTLTQMVLDVAKRGSCPVISAHGGGYVPDVAISAALAHMETLATG